MLYFCETSYMKAESLNFVISILFQINCAVV